jgi:hypothetical protein
MGSGDGQSQRSAKKIREIVKKGLTGIRHSGILGQSKRVETMTDGRSKQLALWDDAVREQEAWIEKCGGSLHGYVLNYSRHGRDYNEIYKIYLADKNELERLKERAGR